MYLLSCSDNVSYSKNDVIIRQGEAFQYMYVIQEGQVRVERQTAGEIENLGSFYLLKFVLFWMVFDFCLLFGFLILFIVCFLVFVLGLLLEDPKMV